MLALFSLLLYRNWIFGDDFESALNALSASSITSKAFRDALKYNNNFENYLISIIKTIVFAVFVHQIYCFNRALDKLNKIWIDLC
jgi:hypothetical protein